MKKSKFSEMQIVSILKQADADVPVKENGQTRALASDRSNQTLGFSQRQAADALDLLRYSAFTSL